MKQDSPSEFEMDPYMERLLALRESDPTLFNMLPRDAKKVLEHYEREKALAQQKDKGQQSK
ncbi:MAG: hypothetical protein LC672_00190, partial [Acidobacteria bacterium]|nr:hypothetical protein [Acidobacteriota bacterium]